MDYYGKCSRCEMVKKDYEEVVHPYDLTLCKLCYYQVKKDIEINNILEKIKVKL